MVRFGSAVSSAESIMFIPAPTFICEQTLATLISGSLNSSGSQFIGTTCYTGMDNEDRVSPAVSVWCRDASEVVFNSRCYAFDVELSVKEMAADNTKLDYSNIAGNVFSYFADSVSGSANINSVTGSGFSVWQCQMMGYGSNVTGDAWNSTFTLKLIGAIVPL